MRTDAQLGSQIGEAPTLAWIRSPPTCGIGFRKAIGGSNRAIFAQFLAETLLVCVSAGTAGALFGALVVMLMARMISEGSVANAPPLLLPERVVMILASLVGIGIAAGLLPAARAARIDPAVSLRAT